jgi:hypothetical protein
MDHGKNKKLCASFIYPSQLTLLYRVTYPRKRTAYVSGTV